MVQQTVDREAEPTDVRLEQDQPAALCEHAAGLVQKDSRGAQVMKDVEQDQVRKAAADKWQFVPVTDQIEPGIREKVGADRQRQVRLQVADPGTDFNDAPGQAGVEQRQDALVKARINGAQQWFVLPGLEVALDFCLVLDEGRAHARRAIDLNLINRSTG